MKKFKASLLVGLLSLFAVSVFAAPAVTMQDTDKSIVSVEVTELPDAVQETLASEKADWTVTKAVLVSKDGKSYYKITLSKDGETKEVKVTPEGELKHK
ncbi:hypothetical protein [Alkalitalea saponilacus]|uniref:Beta-lactamase-inhibitor-like, PepSY-like n=1 Tax=Alkalitalea saponilacus TaxID=889453 RepID=A0A1T5GM42_9BACT|nr:hypothetical protein [Alkalitalea saponilacus]ASB48278.1 hypothetical protein CDL62_03540 [Alkalitalea saponilacus]SKC09486.1 hypothetical protein SAMN03080601_01860 [Alkalitalea saponilacus]